MGKKTLSTSNPQSFVPPLCPGRQYVALEYFKNLWASYRKPLINLLQHRKSLKQVLSSSSFSGVATVLNQTVQILRIRVDVQQTRQNFLFGAR